MTKRTFRTFRTSRQRRPPLVAVLGSALVVGGAALPWGGSGRNDRTGYELARLARRLDVLDGAAASAARFWGLAPLVLAVVVVAAGARRSGVAIVLAVALAAAGAALVVAVHQTPLVPRAGLHVTSAGAAIVVLAALARAATRGRRRRQAPSVPAEAVR